jgi:asparagine synthase (glutamine-hydrolysing)
MSVQFGRWNTDGKSVDRDYLEKVKSIIAPYGPDHGGSHTSAGLSILFRAFHTTKESRRESQPHVTKLGTIITWDGRLDNRVDLIRHLRDRLTASSTDVSIAAAAYEEWGTDCFAKLIGDWALSIWDEKSRSLVLSKDPIGTRHLYYSIEKDQITWSTILDPLVLFARQSFTLNEEYVAGWYSSFPAAHLTPYVGIHSVPPSSFVAIQGEKHAISKYWEFDSVKRIRYSTDAEYEEHFRDVFGEAVRRRLRSDSPILAELSGGMDSSSIVCMADSIIARGSAETPRLDTISYYNNSEPNWNESPYFTQVEKKRGRKGCHIDVGAQDRFNFHFQGSHFAATPCSGGSRPSEASRQFSACMASGKSRVILSGIGGDEVAGGVPSPTPEFENLLAQGQFRTLARQLKVWALIKRRPWYHLFFEAARRFFPIWLVGVPEYKRPASWLNPKFVKRNRRAFQGYPSHINLLGPLPSIRENLNVLNVLRRQLSCSVLSSELPYEKRYPYLDRGLLEFMYSIPREQIVRPGQRRSLTRRALVGIVPDELLSRKRKAFVSRAPMAGIATEWATLSQLSEYMVSTYLGIVDQKRFSQALESAHIGMEVPMITMIRTVHIELWLRRVCNNELLSGAGPILAPGNSLRGSATVTTGRITAEKFAS